MIDINSEVYKLEDKGCPSLLDIINKYNSHNYVFLLYLPLFNLCLKNVLCFRNWCIGNKDKSNKNNVQKP